MPQKPLHRRFAHHAQDIPQTPKRGADVVVGNESRLLDVALRHRRAVIAARGRNDARLGHIAAEKVCESTACLEWPERCIYSCFKITSGVARPKTAPAMRVTGVRRIRGWMIRSTSAIRPHETD